MSHDVFAPLDFPPLPGSAGDERANIRGHAAGYAAGRRQVEQELETLRADIERDAARRLEQHRHELQLALDALNRSAAEFRSRELPVLESVDAAIASAAIELAEAIVGHELSVVPGAARAAVERAVAAAGPVATSIRLNPDDIAVISAETPAPAGLELVADPSLHRGDAIVLTGEGSIDARIASAVARAKAALEAGAA